MVLFNILDIGTSYEDPFQEVDPKVYPNIIFHEVHNHFYDANIHISFDPKRSINVKIVNLFQVVHYLLGDSKEANVASKKATCIGIHHLLRVLKVENIELHLIEDGKVGVNEHVITVSTTYASKGNGSYGIRAKNVVLDPSTSIQAMVAL